MALTMKERGRAHKGVSIGITALMLLMSVAIPLLERAEVVNEPVAESEHNPATCPTQHDHTVCTQVGANASAPSHDSAQRSDHTVVVVATPTQAPTVASATFAEGHPSRAPPLA